MSLSRLVARPLLAAGIIYGATEALRDVPKRAEAAKPVTDKIVPAARNAGVPLPSDPAQLVKINAAVQIVGGLAVATGKAPRLGALAIAASLVPTTIAGHAFWAAPSPEEKRAQRLQFAKNLTMIGGSLIAAGDTDGKPGVAWRTRRAAKDARREAKNLGRSARREAKLAAVSAKAKVS